MMRLTPSEIAIEKLMEFAFTASWESEYLAQDGTVQSKAWYRTLNLFCGLGKCFMPTPDYLEGREQIVKWINLAKQDKEYKGNLVDLIVAVCNTFNTLVGYINKKREIDVKNLRLNTKEFITARAIKKEEPKLNQQPVVAQTTLLPAMPPPLQTYPLYNASGAKIKS